MDGSACVSANTSPVVAPRLMTQAERLDEAAMKTQEACSAPYASGAKTADAVCRRQVPRQIMRTPLNHAQDRDDQSSNQMACAVFITPHVTASVCCASAHYTCPCSMREGTDDSWVRVERSEMSVKEMRSGDGASGGWGKKQLGLDECACGVCRTSLGR